MHQIIITLSFKSALWLKRYPWPDEPPETAVVRLLAVADQVDLALSNSDQTALAFGQRIKKLRKARGLTQARLGKLSGLHGSTICDIEAGHLWPKAETIIALLGVLEATSPEKV